MTKSRHYVLYEEGIDRLLKIVVGIDIQDRVERRSPPKMPMKSEKIVRAGSMSIRAMSFGATRNLTGLIPMLTRASTSSAAFMEPISAAKAEPLLPATMMAVRIGPKLPGEGDTHEVCNVDKRTDPFQLIGCLEGQDYPHEEGDDCNDGDGVVAGLHHFGNARSDPHGLSLERRDEGPVESIVDQAGIASCRFLKEESACLPMKPKRLSAVAGIIQWFRISRRPYPASQSRISP